MGVQIDFSHVCMHPDKIESGLSRLGRRHEELKSAMSGAAAMQGDLFSALPAAHEFSDSALSFASRHADKDTIVVAGIGGSNLGAKAIIRSLTGKYGNLTSDKQVLFAESCDPESLRAILSVVESRVREGKKVMVLGISKSGKTTETVANFEILHETLLSAGADVKDSMAIITDQGSPFERVAAEFGIEAIHSPHEIGGRYSVFTTVGLVPLALVGADVKSVLAGARKANSACLECDVSESPAAKSASILYGHYMSGRQVFDQFIFSPEMEALGKWYRQLLAESSGKEWNIDESARVNTGILPTVSIGTTDLHSVAQLYLAGSRNIYFRLVSYDPAGRHIQVPQMPQYDSLVNHIQGKDTQEILDAILGGVKGTFSDLSIPFMDVRLKSKSTSSLGYIMQFEMIEVVLLCHLLGVNPYDQPNVELYKSATRNILSGKMPGQQA
ncbi:MAG: hypothetical protein WC506_06585 [Candidatus Micrarchaeia archaeon]